MATVMRFVQSLLAMSSIGLNIAQNAVAPTPTRIMFLLDTLSKSRFLKYRELFYPDHFVIQIFRRLYYDAGAWGDRFATLRADPRQRISSEAAIAVVLA